MVIYWFLFGFFALGAMIESLSRRARDARPMLALGAVSVIALIGLRYKVGGDWGSYLFMFKYAGWATLPRVLGIGDPGYQFLNWMVQQLGGKLWHVNLVCALIFTWGAHRLARLQPNPWLAYVIAVPYLIIVVAMGYTRQAVAVGIIMSALVSLMQGGSLFRYAFYVGAAALFHRTSIVALPLAMLATGHNRLINTVGIITAFAAFYTAIAADSLDRFVSVYIKTGFSSQGAAIRVFMNSIPAALFLLGNKRLSFTPHEQSIWRNCSIAAITLLLALFVLPSSTVVDRLSLYVIPLQMAVLSRVPLLLKSRSIGTAIVIAYSFIVQLIWLNFAAHAEKWVPYRFYPMG